MLQECSMFSVADVFFTEPTKQHYLMEISQKAGLAHTSVKKHLERMKETGLIKEASEKKGKRKFPIYTANLENPKYKEYKRALNLLKLEESGLLRYLKDKLMPKSIVLFGSYSRGEDIEDSDIDIFAECKKNELDLSKFEKQVKRKIELHFKEKFKEYPAELKNNIINGIVLSGYLEAF
ncbi:Nucleotidyltransferase domain protein [uncultured archaeon]|nr:Nucleotidyltransferase domain protein [uncultured archaeon]